MEQHASMTTSSPSSLLVRGCRASTNNEQQHHHHCEQIGDGDLRIKAVRSQAARRQSPDTHLPQARQWSRAPTHLCRLPRRYQRSIYLFFLNKIFVLFSIFRYASDFVCDSGFYVMDFSPSTLRPCSVAQGLRGIKGDCEGLHPL
ncbi:hypothetical protein VPH35_108876 [Triticum aestivum]